MSRRKKDPLRLLIERESERCWNSSAARGRRSGDAVSQLVSRFNREGRATPRRWPSDRLRSGGTQAYSGRMRAPARPQEGWNGHLVVEHSAANTARRPRWIAGRQHLHHLVRVVRCRLDLAAGSHLVQDRHRDPQAQGGRRPGDRPGGRGEKNVIEQAYRLGESLGLSVWTEDVSLMNMSAMAPPNS